MFRIRSQCLCPPHGNCKHPCTALEARCGQLHGAGAMHGATSPRGWAHSSQPSLSVMHLHPAGCLPQGTPKGADTARKCHRPTPRAKWVISYKSKAGSRAEPCVAGRGCCFWPNALQQIQKPFLWGNMPTVPQAIPKDAINQLPDDTINQRNALDHRDQPGLNRWAKADRTICEIQAKWREGAWIFVELVKIIIKVFPKRKQ